MEVEKQEEGREERKRMKARGDETGKTERKEKRKVKNKSEGVIRTSSVGLLSSLPTHPLVTKMADLQ